MSYDAAELFEEAAAAVEEMRARIKEVTRLTASAGIACNFMLAKVCADKRKPDGQFCLGSGAGEVADFLRELPVRKIGGIGKVMEKTLSLVGVRTCGELLDSMAAVWHVFTPRTSEWLLRVAAGVGSPDHDAATADALPDGAVTRKGISKERTFRELSTPEDLDAKLRDICTKLAEDMAKRHLQGRVVTLKLKTVEFDVLTRAHTSNVWVSTLDQIYAITSKLLRAQLPLRLRLMGVRVSQFRGQANEPPDPRQPLLNSFLRKPADGGGGSSSARMRSVTAARRAAGTRAGGACRRAP
eukprot:TRINITY_DN481_c0_g5_i1.p3 TRINITY_DN481_c0_g5~~TRINITY_DN481_c0_g5_i1.p3  ORF type:complete len:298 (-),score=128.00 TRINITY_DN481_c0_g5_i1:101-994(-)